MAKAKKLTPRRLAREWALQFLFQYDIRNSEFEEEELELFWEQLKDSPSLPKEKAFEAGCEYANELIRGVLESSKEFDDLISANAANWTLDRIAVVDRNILRIGIYELRKTDLSAKVIIDEAVEIAKVFAEKDSPSFINAVLDNIYKQN